MSSLPSHSLPNPDNAANFSPMKQYPCHAIQPGILDIHTLDDARVKVLYLLSLQLPAQDGFGRTSNVLPLRIQRHAKSTLHFLLYAFLRHGHQIRIC